MRGRKRRCPVETRKRGERRKTRARAQEDGPKMQKKQRWKKKRELISVNCSVLKFAESVLSN